MSLNTRVAAILALVGGVNAPASVSAQGNPPARPSGVGTAVAGQQMPKWQAGMLDIHQLSTGRGNSALIILPDGTSLLIDAGAAGDGIAETQPHPDGTRSPGEWIARYVQRHLPPTNPALDFALITHFHSDHYGQITTQSPASLSTGNFRLSGITEVGDRLKIGTLIDRGWPDYNYPATVVDSTMANYRRFVATKRAAGMRVQRALVGVDSQISLRHNVAAYPDVRVRTIIANGDVWTGQGSGSRSLFPPLASLAREDVPNENMCSVGVKLTYGRFSYFTGGDLPGTADPGFPAWHAVEPAIADVIGRVNVHVVNQHGSMGEESEPFLKALASTALIVPSWAPSHPAPDVLKRIMNSRFAPSERFVFATDLRESARTVIGQRANNLAAPPGNVIVRVEPGGNRYWIIVTSNSSESDSVIAVKGPFNSNN